MDELEEFYTLYNKKRVEYFKKNFIGKNISAILYDVSKEIIMNMSRFYTRLCIIYECLDAIKDENYETEIKNNLNSMSENINGLKKDFERYLNDICQGLAS